MAEKMNQILRLFTENEAAAEALNKAKSKEEAVAILAQHGIELTVEELVEIGTQVTSDELPEEVLMLVSGGGKFWNLIKRGLDFIRNINAPL